MNNTKVLAIFLIIVGIIGLIINSNGFTFPSILTTNWNTIWPVMIIVIGMIIYFLLKKNPEIMDYILLRKPLFISSSDNESGMRIRINNWEPKNPIVKTLVVFGALIFTGVVLILTFLGVVTPIIAVTLVTVGIVLLAVFGVAFLAVLIPLAILLSPILIIIWLLSLIF